MEPTEKQKTGGESSYATALATRLASLLLSYARFTPYLHTKADTNFKEINGLPTMTMVFRALTLGESNNWRVVEPWGAFRNLFELIIPMDENSVKLIGQKYPWVAVSIS